MRLVRYGDDFISLCKSPRDVDAVLTGIHRMPIGLQVVVKEIKQALVKGDQENAGELSPHLFGFRIQKSVFECRMDKRAKVELIEKLEGLDIATGFVKIYKQEYSWKDCIIGKQKKKSIDDDNAFVI